MQSLPLKLKIFTKICLGITLASSSCPSSTLCCSAKSLQSCLTLCDPIDSKPTRMPRPWDSPGKNTGVYCHFLLQCMKVKSESEVAQSCPTLSDPMDCSLPGSSIHGIFQARVLGWGAMLQEAKPHKAARCKETLYSPSWALRGPEMILASIASHVKSNHFEPPT